MWDDFKSFVSFMGVIVLGVSLIILVVLIPCYFLSKSACLAIEEKTGLKTSWHYAAGCFVTLPNGKTLRREEAMKILSNDYKLFIEQN